MRPRTFFGENSREALRQVKEGLGADAVILANRRVERGVEIVALAAQDIAALTTPADPAAHKPQDTLAARVSAGTRPPADSALPSADAVSPGIVAELKQLRALMEEQLAGLTWGEVERRDPARAKLTRLLLNAGFSALLTRQALQKMPPGCNFETGLKWIKAALSHNLRRAGEDDGIVNQGGVYALVGPTGVGKTTTTAKLAARCVVRHGAEKLSLLTTDSYRIGGHEQLRIYGRLLGVAVHAVKDAEDLRLMLAELRHKHLVLIDTVGASQRDPAVMEQEAMLDGCGIEVRRLLLLNATCNGGTLDDVARAFHAARAYGCIVTKVDEAASLGMVLDAIVRYKLMLTYVANGQKVPEDLHPAHAPSLIDCALRAQPEEAPFALSEQEFPMVAAGLATVGGGSSCGAARGYAAAAGGV